MSNIDPLTLVFVVITFLLIAYITGYDKASNRTMREHQIRLENERKYQYIPPDTNRNGSLGSFVITLLFIMFLLFFLLIQIINAPGLY